MNELNKHLQLDIITAVKIFTNIENQLIELILVIPYLNKCLLPLVMFLAYSCMGNYLKLSPKAFFLS